ncbi:MAG: hypothetical protein QM802_12320 [Agriterribacter sp.]
MHKKIFLWVLFAFLLQTSVKAQSMQTTNPSKDLYNSYMHKKKTQKTIAWVMVGSGSAMVIAGMIIYVSQPMFIDLWDTQPAEKKNYNKGLWLCYVGIPVILTSIPFFISSHANKKKAKMALKGEKVLLWPNAPVIHYTALSLKIAL